MAKFAAGLLTDALLKKRGTLLAAVSGGRTPAPLFRALAGSAADWSRVRFFMADERLVSQRAAGSNFGQARRLFFSKIKIPRANLHPVRAAAPGRAAAGYEQELRKFTGGDGGLDIVFLGLGEDGHTASIFPGSVALDENKKLVLPATAPAGVRPASRVTLTLKALNLARTIVLLASGPAKEAAFALAAAGDKSVPAGRLAPRGGIYLLFSEK